MGAKTSENSKQEFPLSSFPAVMTFGYVHVFLPLGRMESPLKKLFILGRRLFQSRAKAHQSHHCEGNTSGKLARNLSMSFKVSRRELENN